MMQTRLIIGLLCMVPFCAGWKSDSDRVLLNDLKVITLYHGRMTNARRSSPIPQMKCAGGTSGCQSFVPQVVQCYNRGTDGYDVQWECQTDMDNAYRFGQVEVSCEGYDYPDDPYILKGSCGLEYTIDLTKEGYAQKNQGSHHNYYGDENSYTNNHTKTRYSSGWMTNLITVAVFCVIIYAIYVTCLSGPTSQRNSWTGNEHRQDNFRPHSSPPPPGFRDDYMPGGGCSSTFDPTYTTPRPNTATGGGFWTGAATGGLLGYMFGARNTGYNTGYQQHPYRSPWGGAGFGGGQGMFSSRSTGGAMSGSSTSTGTRTASGFGGTKRR